MRKQIVSSSWKMHINSIKKGAETAESLRKLVGNENSIEIYIFPTFPMIPAIAQAFKGSSIGWGAQNMCYEEKGAYTGEVPPLILQELGCSYVELGHAERRAYFNETDELINKKVKLAFKYNMKPVVCIGENKCDIEQNVGKVRLQTQTFWALNGLTQEEMKEVILAYEPVWAIGQKEAASPDYVEDIHAFIRNEVKKEFGKEVSEEIRIVYGGSVSTENAGELSKKNNIDGLFIGRFGLEPSNFKKMVDIVKKNNLL